MLKFPINLSWFLDTFYQEKVSRGKERNTITTALSESKTNSSSSWSGKGKLSSLRYFNSGIKWIHQVRGFALQTDTSALMTKGPNSSSSWSWKGDRGLPSKARHEQPLKRWWPAGRKEPRMSSWFLDTFHQGKVSRKLMAKWTKKSSYKETPSLKKKRIGRKQFKNL